MEVLARRLAWTFAARIGDKYQIRLTRPISFTIQFSNVEQSFLDVLVQSKEERVETNICYKDTDSKQYLLFYSCHPRHTKFNVPYNLARRIRTIVSEEHEYRMQELVIFT